MFLSVRTDWTCLHKLVEPLYLLTFVLLKFELYEQTRGKKKL